MPMPLLHPDTARNIRAWLPEADTAIRAACGRLAAVLDACDYRDPVPLAGGAMSAIVVATDQGGGRVVVKAPVRPDLAANEALALRAALPVRNPCGAGDLPRGSGARAPRWPPG